MTLIKEDDPRVTEIVKRVRALRQLAITERMQTYRAQTALLKQLPEDGPGNCGSSFIPR